MRSHLSLSQRSRPLCFAVARIFLRHITHRKPCGKASAEFSITFLLVNLSPSDRYMALNGKLWEIIVYSESMSCASEIYQIIFIYLSMCGRKQNTAIYRIGRREIPPSSVFYHIINTSSTHPSYQASPMADPDHFFQNARKPPSACRWVCADPAS